MLLEARKLDKSFNGVYALKGLDLSLKEGEIHGLWVKTAPENLRLLKS